MEHSHIETWITEAINELGLEADVAPTSLDLGHLRRVCGDLPEDMEGLAWDHEWAWLALSMIQEPVLVLWTSAADMLGGFQFTAPAQIGSVLSCCPMFGCFISDPSGSFVLARDHHGVLRASGRARSWLESIPSRLVSALVWDHAREWYLGASEASARRVLAAVAVDEEGEVLQLAACEWFAARPARLRSSSEAFVQALEAVDRGVVGEVWRACSDSTPWEQYVAHLFRSVKVDRQ